MMIITSPNADTQGNLMINYIEEFIKKNKLKNFLFFKSLGSQIYLSLLKIVDGVATLNGQAHNGRISFLGTNSVIMTKAKLGNYSKLSAGSILYKETGDKCLVTGNPAVEITLKFKSK